MCVWVCGRNLLLKEGSGFDRKNQLPYSPHPVSVKGGPHNSGKESYSVLDATIGADFSSALISCGVVISAPASGHTIEKPELGLILICFHLTLFLKPAACAVFWRGSKRSCCVNSSDFSDNDSSQKLLLLWNQPSLCQHSHVHICSFPLATTSANPRAVSAPLAVTVFDIGNAGLTPNFHFAQVHTCPGIDLLGRAHHLQQSWKTLLDKSGPGLSPGQHSPRDTWGWSPEISSNPNWCNLSPGPGIVSWTESPSTSCLVTCRHNGTIAPESLSWREEIWHWFGFHVWGIGADKLFWGGTAFWFFRLWLHRFLKWSHFSAVNQLTHSWGQPLYWWWEMLHCGS